MSGPGARLLLYVPEPRQPSPAPMLYLTEPRQQAPARHPQPLPPHPLPPAPMPQPQHCYHPPRFRTADTLPQNVCSNYGSSSDNSIPSSGFYDSSSFSEETKTDIEDSKCDNNMEGPRPIDSYAGHDGQNRGEIMNHLRCMPVAQHNIGNSAVSTMHLYHSNRPEHVELGVSPHMQMDGQNGQDVLLEHVESDSQRFSASVNYQFLEQSMSHQSMLNQSISILNQQVVSGRMCIPEAGSDRSSDPIAGTPQLVRTPDGMVLAVMPQPPQVPCVENSNSEVNVAQTNRPVNVQEIITVPLGWRRIVSGTSVLYITPSGAALNALPQLREYLQKPGTCKCGLPCPLWPESVFSFDPKVVSKPYQVPTGSELNKLCNHKRKLLATLQQRQPGTPPPQTQTTDPQKKMAGTDSVNSKKKTKRKSSIAQGQTALQNMASRNGPLGEYKNSAEDSSRDVIINDLNQNKCQIMLSANADGCQPSLNAMQEQAQQATMPVVQNQDFNGLHKNEFPSSRNIPGPHYLTVNSGCINQPNTINSMQKPQQYSNNLTGPPVQGTASLALGEPVLGTNGQIIGVHTGGRPEALGFRAMQHQMVQKSLRIDNQKPSALQQTNVPNVRPPSKEEINMFCLNNQQQLTPEVVQKINQQQQIFIQQNQKQIEIAMKGIKTPNDDHQPKQNQSVHQGQLVIQNGAVLKASPGKTPPWQVKKAEETKTNHRPQRLPVSDSSDDQMSSTDENSDSSGVTPNMQHLQEQNMNPMMYSRVPPLPQHYGMMPQWPTDEASKKTMKSYNKANKKKVKSPEKTPYGNPEQKLNQIVNVPTPSFMDDPSGYLAQQTVLLNNTMSRQAGLVPMYDQYQSSGGVDKVKAKNGQCRRQMSQRGSNSLQNHAPDSSLLAERSENSPENCTGCSNTCHDNNGEKYADCSSRRQLGMKHSQVQNKPNDVQFVNSSPRHSDDSPVTSSTYLERCQSNTSICDNRGPIQGGTISTSNMETLQLPEPSPTPSNSSRNTDTPHSNNGSNGSSLCAFAMPSPAYSNPGSSRDTYNSNPPTPTPGNIQTYNSPGSTTPQNNQSLTGAQVMNFISNHNVNKNLMEVDNISFVGVNPLKGQSDGKNDQRRRIDSNLVPYCPPPHLGGGPPPSLMMQPNVAQNMVTTMASGRSIIRDTITSVLAGKAQTATTSINASSVNYIRLPPPPTNSYAIPPHQPDPFLNSVNLPTSYPLHIAGTVAQSMISKTPLEMVQNVVNNIHTRKDLMTPAATTTSKSNNLTAAQLHISSTGQLIVPANGMPPPAPKNQNSSLQVSTVVTSVTSSIAQVIPTVGGVQQMVNQPAMLVNALPGPFMLPQMMTVDGQVVTQSSVIPQIVTNNIIQGHGDGDKSCVQRLAMLSPESIKKRSKKRKNQGMANVLNIAAPHQNSGNIVLHQTSPQQQSSPQFSPRSFQLSPNNISPPMLQALTIVPGKSGAPAHIVMNNQTTSSNFGSQQIIANSSPTQQINLLQPVNLINNGSGVVPNFQTFQQFLLPNIGGVVMTADGTLIQDNSSGMPVQLQIQTVNGQNVITPVQNNVLGNGNSGVVLRAQNTQGKIIQSQHSPGAQFLSPNSHIMMNSPSFNGQLSPLIANLSPTNVSFNTSPPQVRSGSMPQEIIQCNQLGQTVMVPLSPKPISTTNHNRNNTYVQNTTIVQQQTTLVSNANNSSPSAHNMQGASRLSIDPNILFSSVHKQIVSQAKRAINTNQADDQSKLEIQEKYQDQGPNQVQSRTESERSEAGEFGQELEAALALGHVRHSVSTQTRGAQGAGAAGGAAAPTGGCSPPDTTTHSPLGALEPAASPLYHRSLSMQGNYADTTTKSPEPLDTNSSAMVQYVSSSEPDVAEARDQPAWPLHGADFMPDAAATAAAAAATPPDHQGMLPSKMVSRNTYVESSESRYKQTISVTSVNNQQSITITPNNYYERSTPPKRKNDFGDEGYRPEKMMRSTYQMVNDIIPDDFEKNHMICVNNSRAESSNHNSQVYDRRNSNNSSDMCVEREREAEAQSDEAEEEHVCEAGDDVGEGKQKEELEVGSVVWGGCGGRSWPGKIVGGAGGRWRVRWFGGGGERTVDARRLLTLSQGLDAHHAHHATATRARKGRKLNSQLEKAIQEAMAELDKMSDRSSKTSDIDSAKSAPTQEPRKRGRKRGTSKPKEVIKTNPVRIAPHPKSEGIGGRLRNSR